MSSTDVAALLARMAEAARDGRYELFDRTTIRFDGQESKIPELRLAQGVPSPAREPVQAHLVGMLPKLQKERGQSRIAGSA